MEHTHESYQKACQTAGLRSFFEGGGIIGFWKVRGPVLGLEI